MNRQNAQRTASKRATRRAPAKRPGDPRTQLEVRNNEVRELLAQQAATSEILRVISSSPANLQPVFDTILRNAMRLCGADRGLLRLFDGDSSRIVAEQGVPAAFADIRRNVLKIVPDSAMGQLVAKKRVIHIADLSRWSGYRKRDPITVASVEIGGTRTYLAVPMLKEGSLIGAITILRHEVRPFTDKQVALVQIFADQAVIAIENVRLFNETKEALEQQTVISEILGVISGSLTDVQPVFDAIVKSGVHLFGSLFVSLRLATGDHTELVASTYPIKDVVGRNPLSLDDDNTPGSRAIRRRAIVQVPDILAEEWVSASMKKRAKERGFRAILCVPLLREHNAIGAISVTRVTPGPFTDKQVALAQTFASQAVIAIENVRLFNETREALEQQTATSEILRAISSSPTDVMPVFNAILENGARLCEGNLAALYLYDGEMLTVPAHQGASPELAEAFKTLRVAPSKLGAIRLAALERQIVQVADITKEPGFKPAVLQLQHARTVLGIPLLRDTTLVGVLAMWRTEVRPFAEKQIALLKTFADQAVIAIENVRLFNEIQDKSRQLEIANQHKSDFLASMSHELRTPLNAILGFNEMILGQIYGEVPVDMQEPLAQTQTSGKHLLRLINNVLDIAKIEAGRMELALSDYSVHEIVESVRSTLRSLAADKGLEFLATLPADIPMAYGDAGRITQCLMNLAGNSLKFTKAGKVEISVECQDERLVYRVADTGIGIPPDKIGGLFTEFKQSDATIAREYGGTGLGLSISKKFIEMHGGRIWVKSELGRGSAFIFEIPLRLRDGAAT